jgi:hypothetical protein
VATTTAPSQGNILISFVKTNYVGKASLLSFTRILLDITDTEGFVIKEGEFFYTLIHLLSVLCCFYPIKDILHLM